MIPSLLTTFMLLHAAALLFHGIGVFDVGLAVFTGNFSFLVDHIVPCGPKMTEMTYDELVSLLKDRLKPIA